MLAIGVAARVAACFGTPRVATPPCANPAPLEGERDARAPGYIVAILSDDDARAVASTYANQYAIDPHLIRGIGFIVVAIEPEVLAALR